MYTRWLYTNNHNPTKNLEIRRYKDGHYYMRHFITSPFGAYVFDISHMYRISKNYLLDFIDDYTLYACDTVSSGG